MCVRYRRYQEDEPRQKRLKTVELIVGETDWLPPASQRQRDSVVSLRRAVSEREVREPVKRAGGVWKPARRVWELRFDWVVLLGLEARIVAAQSI
jgi:hypothetical protein